MVLFNLIFYPPWNRLHLLKKNTYLNDIWYLICNGNWPQIKRKAHYLKRNKATSVNSTKMRRDFNTMILNLDVWLTYLSCNCDTLNCGLRMCQQCRERFPHHRLQMKPPVSYPGMHHSTCVTHVLWCMWGTLIRGGGEKHSWHSWCMRKPQFYVSGKRLMKAVGCQVYVAWCLRI